MGGGRWRRDEPERALQGVFAVVRKERARKKREQRKRCGLTTTSHDQPAWSVGLCRVEAPSLAARCGQSKP